MLPPSSHTTGHTVPYHGGSCKLCFRVNVAYHSMNTQPKLQILSSIYYGFKGLFRASVLNHQRSLAYITYRFCPSVCGNKPTMASAGFYHPIPTSHDVCSQWQADRPPKVTRVTFALISAVSTSAVSVQVLGFEDNGLLTHCDRLIYDFCSSDQCFAFSFLQIPPRDGHPCRSANRSPCRVDSGLSPPSHPTATMRVGTAPATALRAILGAP